MTYNTSWLLLIVAGFLEIFFAVGLKSANGLERPWLLVGTVFVLAGSLCLLTMGCGCCLLEPPMRSGLASVPPVQLSSACIGWVTWCRSGGLCGSA